MKLFLFVGIFIFSTAALAKEWTWAGFEIVGYKKAARKDVEAHIPIKMGSAYKEDPVAWEKICGDIRTSFDLAEAKCSSVRYVNFLAYFVIEIVEKGDEWRTSFRKPPTTEITLANPQIMEAYHKLYDKLFEHFNQGVAINETHDKGYLDYSDKEMGLLAQKLAASVPKFHNNILKVLKESKSDSDRGAAANLLNWDKHPSEDVVDAVKRLDDPSSEVRNNISRFALAFVGDVKSKSDRESLIDAFVVQLMRPSHGDRNKAAFSLLNMIKSFPQDGPYMARRGKKDIQFIAEQSVLDNVGGVARQILSNLP